MAFFDDLVATVQKGADSYQEIRKAVAGGNSSTPLVETNGAGSPVVQQGSPAAVVAVPTTDQVKTSYLPIVLTAVLAVVGVLMLRKG